MPKLLLFILSASIFSACNDVPNQLDRANALSKEVRDEFVSDGRVALFDVNIEPRQGELLLVGETNIPEAKSKLLEDLDAAGLAYIDSLAVLPSPALEGKHFGVVNVSVCNIRSKPKHSAELATQALLGTPLRVLKQEGDFYFVQTPDNYIGWLDDGGLVPMTEAEFQEWMSAQRVVCVQDAAYVYSEKSADSGKVSDLVAGNILKSGGQEEGVYFPVIFPDGRRGYVLSGQVETYDKWMATRQPTAENILRSALEFIGRPYLWGGTSGKGMDCSGFTKTVYFLNGIQLERDASLQVHTGELVETDTATWENLQPGDLLFFGRHGTAEKKERISHVAIYMGDGKIIHSSDRVKIESLRRGDPTFVENRLKTFIRAKRILGSEGKNGVIALKDSPWYAVQQ